jgi:hypothetical protein
VLRLSRSDGDPISQGSIVLSFIALSGFSQRWEFKNTTKQIPKKRQKPKTVLFSRGTEKKRNGRPRTSAEPIQKAPTHLLFFLSPPPDLFFVLHFQAFLSKRSSKTPKQNFKSKKNRCRKCFTKK